MPKSKVLREQYSCPELGVVIRENGKTTFNLVIETHAFDNFQDSKEFLRKNQKKMKKIISQYCELASRAKRVNGFSGKKENPVVKAVMQKLGFLDE